jgi:hypothetical protein
LSSCRRGSAAAENAAQAASDYVRAALALNTVPMSPGETGLGAARTLLAWWQLVVQGVEPPRALQVLHEAPPPPQALYHSRDGGDGGGGGGGGGGSEKAWPRLPRVPGHKMPPVEEPMRNPVDGYRIDTVVPIDGVQTRTRDPFAALSSMDG